MVLLNVTSTFEKGAYYPAKPYHEDMDFAHRCEDAKLVVAKCNWLLFTKVISWRPMCSDNTLTPVEVVACSHTAARRL